MVADQLSFVVAKANYFTSGAGVDTGGFKSYKWEPPPGWRTRRKWVRLFRGRASSRRIWSVSARSLSFLSAASWASLFFVFFLFIERFLKDIQDSPITVAVGCPLALNNIHQTRHLQGIFAKLYQR